MLTHLHTDHAGGLHHFPRAEHLVDGAELRAASGAAGRARGYLPHRWPDWFAPTAVPWRDDPVGPFPTRHALTAAGDVVLLPTPGHSAGHLSVLVRDGARELLLAGDVAYSAELLADQVVDGVAPSRARALDSMRRAHDLGAVALPTHDPAAAARLAAA